MQTRSNRAPFYVPPVRSEHIYNPHIESYTWTSEPVPAPPQEERTPPPRGPYSARKRRRPSPDLGDPPQASDGEDEEGSHEDKPARTYFTSFRRSRELKGKAPQRTTFAVGDCVTVRTQLPRPSVGVIEALYDLSAEEDEEWKEDKRDVAQMVARVHWFTRPSDFAQHRAQRKHGENEIYYSFNPSYDTPITSILTHVSVSSKPVAPAPSPKRKSSTQPLPPERLYATHAVDGKRNIFYKFDWDAVRARGLAGEGWTVEVSDGDISEDELPRKGKGKGKEKEKEKGEEKKKEKGAKAKKARRVKKSDDVFKVDLELDEEEEEEEESSADDASEFSKSESESDEDDSVGEDEMDEDSDDAPRTPSRKRKRGGASTPRRVQPTPHSKRALKMRRAIKAARPLPPPAPATLAALPAGTPRDVHSLSRALLHVGATPGYLPCREDEYLMVEGCIESLLEEGGGGCVYISGTPGTGKTATVHSVIRSLQEKASNNEINPFTFVEINGLRVSEPARAYSLLWEAIAGEEIAGISPKAALAALERYFAAGGASGPAEHACIVLMDELDQLVTPKQNEVYNFFNWPSMRGSRLIVIAVANTMDLPEKVLRGKVASRLGMERINFAPYTTDQLSEITISRIKTAVSLATCPPRSDEPIVSQEDADPDEVFAGDAIKLAAMRTASVQGDARRMLEICRQTLETCPTLPIETPQVNATIRSMTQNPTARTIRNLSVHGKIMLLSVMRAAERAGLGTGECKWGEVSAHHLRLAPLILEYQPLQRISTADQLALLSTLCATRLVLAQEPGGGRTKEREVDRKIIRNVPETDIRRVLGEDRRFKHSLG